MAKSMGMGTQTFQQPTKEVECVKWLDKLVWSDFIVFTYSFKMVKYISLTNVRSLSN